jgi:hypothetical protein
MVFSEELIAFLAQASFKTRSAGFPSILQQSESFFAFGMDKVLNNTKQCLFPASNSYQVSNCSYFQWLFLWAVFPIAVAASLCIYCLCFCIGRCFCSCCCQPCAPSCGGSKPTMTYSVAWARLLFIVYLLTLSMLALLSLSGLICMLDASSSITSLGSETKTAIVSITHRVDRIGLDISQISPVGHAVAAQVNRRLDGLSAVRSTSRSFLRSLTAADARVRALQSFVEGCEASVSVCRPQENLTVREWNECINGRHEVGRGAQMTSGRPNPACMDETGASKPCPCCTNCTLARRLLLDSSAQIPSDFNALDMKISTSEIDQFFKEIIASARNLTHASRAYLIRNANETQNIVGALFSSSSLQKEGLRQGSIFALWAPGWLAMALALLGLFLAPCSEPFSCAQQSPLAHPGSIGHCAHWAAFVLGVLWVSFITLPACAALAVVSMPLSDLCRLGSQSGPHRSGGPIAMFLDGSRGVEANAVSDLVRRCVLQPNSSMLDDSFNCSVDVALDPMRVLKNRIKPQAVLELLSPYSQSGPFEQARGDIPSHMMRHIRIQHHDTLMTLHGVME